VTRAWVEQVVVQVDGARVIEAHRRFNADGHFILTGTPEFLGGTLELGPRFLTLAGGRMMRRLNVVRDAP
jgi:hypothetical protein